MNLHPMDFRRKLLNGSRWLWGAAGAGTVTGALGSLALWAGHAWLIPSLGPSILMQCYMPRARESQLYPVVAGQVLGVIAGTVAVMVTGTQGVPSELISGEVHPLQVVAAVIAVILTLLLQVMFRAIHPPAASTALLLATGSFRVATSDLLTMTTGILLVGVLGEPLRRWRAVHLRNDATHE